MIICFAANRLVLNIDKLIHNKKFITFYTTYYLKRKVYRRNCKNKISWFTNL